MPPHFADAAPGTVGGGQWHKALQSLFLLFTADFWAPMFSVRTLPLCGHGCHGVNAHEHRGDGEPVLKPAELLTKVPDVVAGVNKIEDGIESRHQQIRKSQIDDKVISSRPHSPVRKNDPDDGDVANDGCDNDEGVGDSPQSNLPSRLGELGDCRPIAAVLEGLSLR